MTFPESHRRTGDDSARSTVSRAQSRRKKKIPQTATYANDTEQQSIASTGDRATRRDGGVLTVREAATFLRVSQSTIRNAIRGGQLRVFRFGTRGGSIRIAPSALEEYMAACQTDAERPVSASSKSGGSSFKNLDAAKLLAAWRQQGVLDSPPNGNSARSSESRCDP